MIEIDALVFFAHLIADDVVSLAGKIEFVAVRQVPAMGEIEAHDGVARLQHGGVGGLVGLRSGMRLHVDVLGVEELFCAIAGEVLHFVGILAAAVVALAGIAFGVFIGEDAAGGFENGFGGEVLAGDQLDLAVLAAGFLCDQVGNGGIDFGKRASDGIVHDWVGMEPRFYHREETRLKPAVYESARGGRRRRSSGRRGVLCSDSFGSGDGGPAEGGRCACRCCAAPN